MKKNLIWVILALVVVIGGIYWYKSKENSTDNKIKVGVILPFSGELSSYGDPMKEGILLFIEENKDSVNVIFEDSKGNPKDGISSLNKLLNIDKTKYIIGDVVSQVTLSLIPIIEKNDAFLLSPGASSPKLNNISKNFARNYPSSVDESLVSARYANEIGKSKAFVLYVNSEFGEGLYDLFSKEFERLGGKVSSMKYEEGIKDFKNIISKLNSLDFDILYLAGNQIEMGSYIKQFKQLNNKKNTLIISNISFLEKSCLEVAGEAAEGVLVPTVNYDPNDPKVSTLVSFTKKFKEKYKKEPTIVNAVGYDASKLIFNAINNVGNDPIKVSEYIRNLKNYEGALGILNFTDGDVTFPMHFHQIKANGETEIIK